MIPEVRKTMDKGRLIIFSAPSGCGKGTMLAEILKDERFRVSVSATTRKPREGEVDGVNYHFLTREQFEERIENEEFLEYAQYCDNFYGTLNSEVDFYLEKGIDVILEIEVQGAMKEKETGCAEHICCAAVSRRASQKTQKARHRDRRGH